MALPACYHRVRALPLLAALLLAGLPTSAASGGSGIGLAGPASVVAAEPTSVPLLVSLTLDRVACGRETEVPVHLSLGRKHGARAELASDRVVFRVAPHSALARPWTSDARAHLLVEPVAGTGLVEVVARYELPADCVTLAGARSGEARHAIRVHEATTATPSAPAPATYLRQATAQDEDVPLALQAWLVGTAIAGMVVVGKRLRARGA